MIIGKANISCEVISGGVRMNRRVKRTLCTGLAALMLAGCMTGTTVYAETAKEKVDRLEAALKHPGSLEDIVLREGDVLTIPQYSNTVKISGEVVHPISMNYMKGKSLSYYISHAGGYGNKARKGNVYAVYANGGVEKIRKRSSKAIQ